MRIFPLSTLILDWKMFWIFTKYEYVVFVIYYFIFQQNTSHEAVMG